MTSASRPGALVTINAEIERRAAGRKSAQNLAPIAPKEIDKILSIKINPLAWPALATESQRAMVAARLANIEPSHHAAPIGAAAISQPDAAKRLAVGRRTVQRAKTVIGHGVPELIKAVEGGTIKLGKAVVLAEAEPEQQVSALAGGKAEVAKAVKSSRCCVKRCGRRSSGGQVQDGAKKTAKILAVFLLIIG